MRECQPIVRVLNRYTRLFSHKMAVNRGALSRRSKKAWRRRRESGNRVRGRDLLLAWCSRIATARRPGGGFTRPATTRTSRCGRWSRCCGSTRRTPRPGGADRAAADAARPTPAAPALSRTAGRSAAGSQRRARRSVPVPVLRPGARASMIAAARTAGAGCTPGGAAGESAGAAAGAAADGHQPCGWACMEMVGPALGLGAAPAHGRRRTSCGCCMGCRAWSHSWAISWPLGAPAAWLLMQIYAVRAGLLAGDLG